MANLSLNRFTEGFRKIKIYRKFTLAIAASLIFLLFLLFILHGCISSELPDDAEFTAVHLTDLHLASDSNVTETPWTNKIIIGGYKLHKPCTGRAFQLLAKAVTLINDKIKPDIVVVTGDLTNNGDDTEALKTGLELLSLLKCPVIIAKGDHDVAKKAESKNVFESLFGPLDGFTILKGYSLFYIPHESNPETLKRLEKGISETQNSKAIRFLCMHRMLYASWGMKTLSKKYASTLLAPDNEMIMDILKKSSGQWIVLCGHSHTNYENTEGNITELCTASLAEYPHELRIVKIKAEKLYTKIINIDEPEPK